MKLRLDLFMIAFCNALLCMDVPEIKRKRSDSLVLRSSARIRARVAASGHASCGPKEHMAPVPPTLNACHVLPTQPVQVYTPTSTKVRSRLLKSMTQAVYGVEGAQDKLRDLSADQELLCASPQSYARICNQKLRKMVAQDFEKRGISPQDLHNHVQIARASIRKYARDTAQLPAASDQIRALGKRLLSEITNPPRVSFRHDRESEEIAYANDTYVGLNEDEIKSDQMNESELAWLVAHEIEHIIQQDELIAHAYKLAARSKGRKKKEFKDLRLVLSYLHEVFADVTPALRTKSLAHGYVACLAKWVADDPEGKGDEHPMHAQRLDLAKDCVAFWDQSEREQERMVRRNLQLEFDKLSKSETQ